MTYSNFGKMPDLKAQFLLLAVRSRRSILQEDRFVKLFQSLGETHCRELARLNQIEHLVGASLIDLLGRNSLSNSWTTAIEKNCRRVEGMIKTLVSIAQQMDQIGCKYAIVESAGVLLGSQLQLGAFESGDADLLVESTYFEDIKRCFEQLGFVGANRRDRPTARVEYTRVNSNGVREWFNVGCVPFDRMWVPFYHRDMTTKWLSNTKKSNRIGELSVLNTEDALTFVSTHTSLHSFVRSPGLRLHVDVDRLVCDNSVNWQKFLEATKSLGPTTRVFVSQVCANEFLNTPVPQWVLRELHPGALKWNLIRALLRHNSVIADGKRKLNKMETLLLDFLLTDDSLANWLKEIVYPSEHWMRDHFDRQGKDRAAIWRLHGRRLWRLVNRWDPR